MDNYQNIFNITHSPRFDVIVGRKRAIDGQCQCFPMFFIMFTIIVLWGTVRRRPNQIIALNLIFLFFSSLESSQYISLYFHPNVLQHRANRNVEETYLFKQKLVRRREESEGGRLT